MLQSPAQPCYHLHSSTILESTTTVCMLLRSSQRYGGMAKMTANPLPLPLHLLAVRSYHNLSLDVCPTLII
jgi:hypothetical protein